MSYIILYGNRQNMFAKEPRMYVMAVLSYVLTGQIIPGLL